MTPISLYAVALKAAAAEPLAPADFLAGRKGGGRDSARAFLRSQPGFLGRGLGLEEARELKDAAGAAGFETVLALEDEVPVPPTALKVSKLEFKDAGFSATAGGAIQFVEFAAVTLLTAAAFDAPAPQVGLAAPEPGLFERLLRLAGAPAYEPVIETGARDTFFRADLLAEGGLHLLLEPENLDFSPLGPGRSPSSLINFRELLKRLSAACPQAVSNAFLPAFLAGKPLPQLKLAGPQACGTELSRLLLVTPQKR